MKRLLDQNLSPKLVARLADLFSGSNHVQALGLDQSDDNLIWDHARAHDFVIVTKDADYNNMVVVRGFPPKVLWLLIGNCTTTQVERVIRANHASIEAFGQDPSIGTLCLR